MIHWVRPFLLITKGNSWAVRRIPLLSTKWGLSKKLQRAQCKHNSATIEALPVTLKTSCSSLRSLVLQSNPELTAGKHQQFIKTFQAEEENDFIFGLIAAQCQETAVFKVRVINVSEKKMSKNICATQVINDCILFPCHYLPLHAWRHQCCNTSPPRRSK